MITNDRRETENVFEMPQNFDEWVEIFNNQHPEVRAKLARMTHQQRVQYMLGYLKDCCGIRVLQS